MIAPMNLQTNPWSPEPLLSSAVPGPLNRTTFFDEQRRNRRATWRLAVGCAIAVAIVGIPISLVLSPILYAVALVIVNTIHLFAPIATTMSLLQGAGKLAFSVLDYLAGEPGVHVSTAALSFGIAAWFAPGILAVALIWLGIYCLFKHSGVGSIVVGVGARAPKNDDLEEQQLGNLVQEMALAAGISPPRLMLLDSDFINAGAIGSSIDDATVIVSRRLLEELDREETQGVIGHLIGSVANGDLRIAFAMTSVLLTFGALTTILKAPFGPRGRATFSRLLRLGLKGWRRRLDGDADRELLTRLIDEGMEVEGAEDQRIPMLLAPFMLASISVQWSLFILVPGLLKPLLALLWRKRRYLADATAVQLTRNPEGVTRALMRANWGTVPGGAHVAHLFVIGPAGAENVSEFLSWQGIGFHPPLKQRLKRLRAAGAQADISSFLRPP
ncbi:MAG TPA: M48 family metalloprotease, partial [Terriglobales bacterium]|nr:M48 family metalloprotease [Terriglobales bacterium]